MTSRSIHHALAIVATAVLAACGGGGGGGDGNTTVTPSTSAAPSITGQPTAAAVNAGQTATFSVAATGSGTLTYQWQKNGVDIPGATGASYTTPTTTALDDGAIYSVKVGNANGTTTSSEAALTVSAGGATIQATQQSANDLVATVNAGVATLRQADAARRFGPGGARTWLLPGGATQTYSEPCTTGSIDISADIDESAGRPISATFAFNNCRFLEAGVDSFVKGSGAMTFTNWADASNYAFTLAYNISYSFNYGGQVEQGTINSTESCTVTAGNFDCTFFDGNNQIRSVSLTTNGTVTTVNDAFIDTPTIDCDYNAWVYDSATGRATSGSVTVTDGLGNRAVITVTANGYQVVVTVNGTTSTWTVTVGG